MYLVNFGSEVIKHLPHIKYFVDEEFGIEYLENTDTQSIQPVHKSGPAGSEAMYCMKDYYYPTREEAIKALSTYKTTGEIFNH